MQGSAVYHCVIISKLLWRNRRNATCNGKMSLMTRFDERKWLFSLFYFPCYDVAELHDSEKTFIEMKGGEIRLSKLVKIPAVIYSDSTTHCIRVFIVHFFVLISDSLQLISEQKRQRRKLLRISVIKILNRRFFAVEIRFFPFQWKKSQRVKLKFHQMTNSLAELRNEIDVSLERTHCEYWERFSRSRRFHVGGNLFRTVVRCSFDDDEKLFFFSPTKLRLPANFPTKFHLKFTSARHHFSRHCASWGCFLLRFMVLWLKKIEFAIIKSWNDEHFYLIEANSTLLHRCHTLSLTPTHAKNTAACLRALTAHHLSCK